MLDRLDTWVILALLAAVLCCALVAALSHARMLAGELRRREQELRAKVKSERRGKNDFISSADRLEDRDANRAT